MPRLIPEEWPPDEPESEEEAQAAFEEVLRAASVARLRDAVLMWIRRLTTQEEAPPSP